MGKKTLAEQIAKYTKPATEFDIEDSERNVFEHKEESGLDNSSESEDETLETNHYVKVDKSKLRDNKPVVGEKYTGKASSRKELFDDEIASEGEESSQSDEELESDNEEKNDDIEDDEGSESGFSLKTDSDDQSVDESADEPETEAEAEEDEDITHKRSKLKELMNNERKHIVNRLSTSGKTDALKGYAVKHQTKLYDQILDSRIKLQKGLTTSNLLPLNNEIFEEFKTEKTSKNINELEDSLYNLLDSVMSLRNKLYIKDHITTGSKAPIKPKKRSFEEYSNSSGELDKALNSYRGQVLNKWSHKVQSASGSTALNASKFKAINQSSESQVQANLADMERLIKRTRLNRRNIKPLGYLSEDEDDEEEEANDDDEPPSADRVTKNTSLQENENIFDDEDFYRVLLNDLVDKKINESNPTSGLTIALSKTKFKKNVDTKASKGRKLRYHIQEPIQNFEAPRAASFKWNDDQIDEFFASLLGQQINLMEHDEQAEQNEEDLAIANDDIQIFG